MNRRGFLARLCALAAAPLASLLAVNGGTIRLFAGSQPVFEDSCFSIFDDTYVAIMHPDCLNDFVSITAKGRWLDAYREARRAGDAHLSAQEIFAKYGQTLSIPTNGEIGSFESVRFIATKEIARGI